MNKKVFLVIIAIVFIVAAILLVLYNEKTDDNVKNNPTKTVDFKTTTKSEKKENNTMDGITINYHASIRMEKSVGIIYFDPYKIDAQANDADYIFITHSHYDHYSQDDIKKVMNDNTKFIITTDLESKVKALGVSDDNITVVYPDKEYKVKDINFETIPSYNTNKTYHKKSYNWVGYNVMIDGIKYYVVGDSDATDELKSVKCDVIFIPVGGTYTMTDEEAANVVNQMDVKYAIPIHYGEVGSKTNAENFVSKLNDNINGVVLK